MKICFFGSSLVSCYWNGAATYYRGMLKEIAALGHEITFFEPDAFERQAHRDIEDPSYARVSVYPASQDGWQRSLAEAIGDTRVHFASSYRRETESFEAEQSFPHAEAKALQAKGWNVNLPEAAGTGRYFGGINAIEFNADGSLTGYADPRRTNVAGGY